MSRYSILTVDLNKKTESSNREKFNSKLKELKWKKIEKVTTLWFASWKDNLTDKDIIDSSKKDVSTAAKHAEIKSYDATVAVCGKPEVWSKP